ncbi:MAG: M14 family metallopeptidase [Cytophagales bacterium]|nr:M14 family metallopeptidase [Cytophagales bacterium]MDW8384705.1 M14 family metallopeptidase [Flammeovirgaceae bacterium]
MKHTLFVFYCLSLSVEAQVLLSPAQFLGYELGDRFTYHHYTINYFEHVAQNSDKVQLIYYGKSYEQRPLLVAAVSSPKNLKHLNQIGKNNRIRAGLDSGTIQGVSVPIIWLGYNIHGDEAVSTEVAMQFLYEALQLPASYLDSLLIIIDPCLNPDGRERYVQWYQRAIGRFPNVYPSAWEHYQPWPGGRFNHYGIDLNRDWAWQSQVETESRMKIYRQFMPQVYCDFHEMGPEFSYYFAPAAQPYHELIHRWHLIFQDSLGKANAQVFDQKKWLYFTKEIYDLLYPAYGETYPILHGATAFTFEQGGGGKAGIALRTSEGDTLTLKDRIAHHLAVSHSVIQTSFRLKHKLLQEFENYFKRSIQSPEGIYKTYVIKAENSPDRLRTFLALLDKQQIQYGRVTSSIKANGYAYHRLQQENFEITPYDVVISAYQPMSNLLKVLFEHQTILKDSQTYDLTAWTLPYAFGLQCYATSQRINPSLSYVSNADTVLFPSNVYAFAVAWQDLGAAKLLSHLLQKGFRVRYAEKPFVANNQLFGEGSLLITAYDNRHILDFENTTLFILKKYYVKFSVLASGLVQEGKDIGSRFSRLIQPPKIALLIGEHINPTAVGEIWHFFDYEIEYPITLLENMFWEYYDLDDFDVLILPSGNYQRLKTETKLMEFVEHGGRIIALENAVSLFAKKNGKTTLQIKEVNSSPDSLPIFGKLSARNQSNNIAGAICQVLIDTTHPIGFGLSRRYFSLKSSETYYQYLEKQGFNVGIYPTNAIVNGFAGTNARKSIEKTLALGIESYGKGSIVYFTDNPLMRLFWYNGKLLFFNSLFLGYNLRYHRTAGE